MLIHPMNRIPCATEAPRPARQGPTASAIGRDGFTLVELLVVIGIIAVLIAILMPALNKARISAVMTQCEANHRQIMYAVQLYAQDNDGFLTPQYITMTLPTKNGPVTGAFPWYTNQFLGRYLNSRDPVAPEASTKNFSIVTVCPTIGVLNYDRLGIGMCGCYDSGLIVVSSSYKQVHLASIRSPSKQIMFVDVRSPDSAQTSYRFEQYYEQEGSPHSWNGSLRSVAYRHGNRTVVSFADGHVDTFATNDPNGTNYKQGLHAAFLAGEVKDIISAY